MRRAFAILCVAVGFISSSSVIFSKELSAGLGEKVYDLVSSWSGTGGRAIIAACHPEEKSFTISLYSILAPHNITNFSTRVRSCDSFVVFDEKRKPRTVKFVSFGENCTGTFEIPN